MIKVYDFHVSLLYFASTTAPEEVKDGTNGEDAAHDPADPDVEACECQRCTEDVEERLDPGRLCEGAVLFDVSLPDEQAHEEETEEGVVAFNNPRVQSEIAITDSEDGEDDGQGSESDR